jgi:hypothetical protein
VRSSITSKSSQRGFASAPSADSRSAAQASIGQLLHKDWGFWRHHWPLATVRAVQIPKNFGPVDNTCHTISCAYGCAQNCSHPHAKHWLGAQPRPIPNHCTQTTQPGPESSTTRSPPPAARTSCCPQLAQPLLLLLKSLPRFLFRKRHCGRAVPHPDPDPGKRWVSLNPISFQVGLRRSTVVVRLPFRSSEWITGAGVCRRGTPHLMWGGAADVGLAVRGDEGTQWTWRRPQSA